MSKQEIPMTPGVRMLIDKKIPFVPHLYRYEEHGGTANSAKELNVPEHSIVKTLVMQTDERKPLIVLMHGDREVSAKNLARFMNVKNVQLCEAATAQRFTGYQFGGTSPFGTRTPIPVFAGEIDFFTRQNLYQRRQERIPRRNQTKQIYAVGISGDRSGSRNHDLIFSR